MWFSVNMWSITCIRPANAKRVSQSHKCALPSSLIVNQLSQSAPPPCICRRQLEADPVSAGTAGAGCALSLVERADQSAAGRAWGKHGRGHVPCVYTEKKKQSGLSACRIAIMTLAMIKVNYTLVCVSWRDRVVAVCHHVAPALGGSSEGKHTCSSTDATPHLL